MRSDVLLKVGIDKGGKCSFLKAFGSKYEGLRPVDQID
jgi:hypothetical protein